MDPLVPEHLLTIRHWIREEREVAKIQDFKPG